MVATSHRRLILAFLALLAALAVVGCARPMGMGTEVGGSGRWVRVTLPKRVMVSTYERAPVFDWRRFVVGPPCAGSVFAYVRLGLAGAADPVAVER